MNLVLSCGCIFIQSLLVCALYCGAFSWIKDFTMSVSPHITDEGIFMKFDNVEFYYHSLSVRSNFN